MDQQNQVGITDEEVAQMTAVQLKAELKKRKLKVSGVKEELVARLMASLQLEREHGDPDTEDAADDSSSSEAENDNDTVRGRTGRTQYQSTLTFRDVEETMETFSGDDRTNVSKWVRSFEESAELFAWSDVQKMAYAKRLLRGSAKLFANLQKIGPS